MPTTRLDRPPAEPLRDLAAALLALLALVSLADPTRVSSLMSNSVDEWERNNVVVCNGIPGLTKEQRELCHRSPDVTDAAIKGLHMAIAECQHQFTWHRWNCSSLTPSSITQHSSIILNRGYRETGFVYAIASAGVAHSVSRACSMGRLISCGCDPSSYTGRASKGGAAAGQPGGTQWKWGGCSHNLDFGIEFSKQFLDAREQAGDIQSTVNLHNNHAGRMAVASNMQVRCKCHGMSGSCELKTCWKVVPEFRVVGRALKSRFRKAVAVAQSNLGQVTPLSRLRGSRRRARVGRNERNGRNGRNGRNKRNRLRLGPNSAGPSPGPGQTGRKAGVTEAVTAARRNLNAQLFFFQKSPNFCERDAHADIAGTAGRKCNRPSAGGDGCASLCCGRGYNVVRQRRQERCACKFHWCCFVQCQNCTVEEWITVCK